MFRKLNVIASIVVMAVVLTAFAMPVFAGEVDQFGYNPERNRVVPDKSYLPMYPLWVYESGRSNSQPLILKGEHFGVENPVSIVLANNILLGFESTPRDSEFSENKNTIFSYPMPGPHVKAGGSYVTWHDGIIYVGSTDGKLYMFRYDISSKKLVKIIERNIGGAKLVSAPLVTQYKGQTLVICANGDGGEVVIVTNFNKPTPDYFKYSFGKGTRVSGSPVPIGSDGFIATSDGAGKVRGYYFEDILGQDSNGFLTLKQGANSRWEYKTPTGVPASCAISGDKVYFSDKDGRFYCLNKYTGALAWKVTRYSGGSFINNSPGVYDGRVFFTMTNYLGTGKGAMIIVNAANGAHIYRYDFMTRAVTAPVIWPSAGFLMAGTEGGWLSIRRLNDYQHHQVIHIFEPTGTGGEPRSYADGFSGEISVGEGLLVVNGTATEAPGGRVVAWSLADKPLPDLWVKTINPGTTLTEPGVQYNGSVTFGFKPNPELTEPVEAKLELYHINKWGDKFPIPEVHNKVYNFMPGEEKTWNFTYHGLKDSNSKIEAVVRPAADHYWPDNIKNVVVKSKDIINLKVVGVWAPPTGQKGAYIPVQVVARNESTKGVKTNLVLKANGAVVFNRSLDLHHGETYDTWITYKANQTGKITFEAEINPSRSISETTFADNKASKTVSVNNPSILTGCPSNSNLTDSWDVTYTGVYHRECCGEDGCWCCDIPASKTVTYNESFKIVSAEMGGNWRSIEETTIFDIANGGTGKTLGGFPITIKIKTRYETDWETKPVYFDHGTGGPKGGTYHGPTRLQIHWSNATATELERTSFTSGTNAKGYWEEATWELPQILTKTKGWQRWYKTNPDAKPDIYTHFIQSNEGGHANNICLREHFNVEVTGSMLDIVTTHVAQ